MFSSSSTLLGKHIVFLGSGKVNSHIASYILSHWFNNNNNTNNNSKVKDHDENDNNKNNKITFFTRDSEDFIQDFIAENVPYFLTGENRKEGHRFLKQTLSVRNVVHHHHDSSLNDGEQDSLFSSADAIFCGIPLHHVSSYFEQIFTNNNKDSSSPSSSEKLIRSLSSTPIFMISRGIHSLEDNDGQPPTLAIVDGKEQQNSRAVKPIGISTCYKRDRLVTQQQNTSSSSSVMKTSADNTMKKRPFWCGATIAEDFFAKKFNGNVTPNIYALGGLVSTHSFYEAGALKMLNSSLERRLNINDEESNHVNDHRSIALMTISKGAAQPSPMVLGVKNDRVDSQEKYQSDDDDKTKSAIFNLLQKDLGLVLEKRVVENLEEHALLDSLLIPASLGGGIVKSAAMTSISSLMNEVDSSVFDVDSIRATQHRATSTFHQNFLNDCLSRILSTDRISNKNDNNLDEKETTTIAAMRLKNFLAFSSAYSQACNVSLGFAMMNNIPEYARKVMTLDCDTSEEAESQVFRRYCGHNEAMHSTLEALPYIFGDDNNNNCGDENNNDTNTFTVLSDFTSGYYTPEVCARFLMTSRRVRTNKINDSGDGDNSSEDNDDEAASMQPLKEHYLLPDLRRLDKAVEEGSAEGPEQMMKLLKNVSAFQSGNSHHQTDFGGSSPFMGTGGARRG